MFKLRGNDFIISFFLLLILILLSLNGCSKKEYSLPDWVQPGIRQGSDFLTKKLYLEDSRLGVVTDIERLDSTSDYEIAIAGSEGALFLNKDIQKVEYVKLESDGWQGDFKIIDADGDGIYEFARIAGAAATRNGLLDHNGKYIWKTTDSRSHDFAYGDINGDGKLEFTDATFDGIKLYDFKGKELWRAGRNMFFDCGIADIDGKGNYAVVCCYQSGTLVLIDKSGNEILQTKPNLDGYFSEFSIISYPSRQDRSYLFIARNKEFILLDFDGKTKIAEFKGSYLSDAVATPVRFKSDHPPYFAIYGLLKYKGRSLVGYEAVHSGLYIYDSSCNLVYHEVLVDEGEAICAVPSDTPGEEVLLVGGTGKVWEYKIRSDNHY